RLPLCAMRRMNHSGGVQANASMTMAWGWIAAGDCGQSPTVIEPRVWRGSPGRISGAMRARTCRSSTHSLTGCPLAASCRESRQHTPASPRLSMTRQKISKVGGQSTLVEMHGFRVDFLGKLRVLHIAEHVREIGRAAVLAELHRMHA